LMPEPRALPWASMRRAFSAGRRRLIGLNLERLTP